MITATQLRDIIRDIVRQERKPMTKLGTIPATYTTGKPTVQFDGESSASTKQYPYLASYTPTAGDRVLLLRVGTGWVIAGKVIS
jgi:hypothetical protein